MDSSPAPLLVIEDNPADLRLLVELLREEAPGSFEIHPACRLSEGIAALRSRSFEAILLDLSLPDGQGLDLIDAVREEAPGVPILVLSGVLDRELVTDARMHGAAGCFIKGCETIHDLVCAIRCLEPRSD